MKTMNMKKKMMKVCHMFGVFGAMLVLAVGVSALRFALFAPELMSATF